MIFLSDFVRRHYVDAGLVPPERAVVIPHGIPRCAAAANTARERSRYVLLVSHLYPYKNVEELIRGFASVARGDLADVELRIAGGDPLGGAADRLRAVVEETGARVRLLGAVSRDEVRRLLSGAAVFAFPSTCENCPIALMEALSFGVPVASSPCASMPEILGEAALYFDPHDPADIGRTLEKILRDEGLAANLGARALERARGFLQPIEVARRTMAVLEEAAEMDS